MASGCHTGRDTVAAIGAAGFAVEEVDRFRFSPDGPPAPATPHALDRRATRITWIVGVLSAVIAGLLPIAEAAELTNIGIRSPSWWSRSP